MKKSLLFAILALSVNAFAQVNPKTLPLLDSRGISMHQKLRQHDAEMFSSANHAKIPLHQGVGHSSREVLGQIERFDSIYMWGWDTLGAKLALQSKITDVLYNADNYPTSLTYESWNGSSWDKSLQFVYTYDANNNQTSQIFKSWTGTAWMNAFQSMFTYDANNDQITQLDQYWAGIAWLNSSYYTFTYDGNHHVLTETDQIWDGASFVNSSKYTYTYSNNNQTSYLSQYWDDVDALWINDTQSLSTYDGNNNLTSSTYQTWNGLSWDNSSLTTYTYDGNNNQISELDQYWDGTQWVNVSKTTYTYDGFHNVTNSLTQNWNVSNFDNAGRVTNTYNGSHLLTNQLIEIWNGTTWKYSDVTFYTYGENNFISGEGSRAFDGIDNIITSGDSTHYYFKTVAATKDLIPEDESLTVSPNPSNGNFTLTSAISLGNVEIFNFLGEQVYTARKINGQTSTEINLTGIAKGIYLIVVTDGTKVTNRMVMLQ